jgi:hypothetical protein
MMSDEVWQLVRDDQTVAALVVTGADFPWLHARLQPEAAFEQVRPLFDEELRLLDQPDDDTASWEASYQRIRQTLRLITPEGHPVPEFLLHIDGAEAWWRWSDTPFG